MGLSKFLDEKEQQRVVDAIRAAELRTSGEIRVHIEPHCPYENPLQRAVELFEELGMQKTAGRNGVLIYVAFRSRSFAIIGDCGINERVGELFWEEEREVMAHYLSAGRPAKALTEAIAMVGERLSEYFPHQDDDINELSDEISYKE